MKIKGKANILKLNKAKKYARQKKKIKRGRTRQHF
jgi:hypothetical protein